MLVVKSEFLTIIRIKSYKKEFSSGKTVRAQKSFFFHARAPFEIKHICEFLRLSVFFPFSFPFPFFSFSL